MRVPTTELQVFSHRRSNQTITATAGHPFWVAEGDDLLARGRVLELPAAESHVSRGEDSTGGGGRWTEARWLRLGDQFLTRTGKSATVVGLTTRLERLTVYNLHVLDAHTYAVADCGVLVHNACNPLARNMAGSWHGARRRWAAGFEAAHIVPSGWKLGKRGRWARDMRRKMREFGIDIHDPRNGFWTRDRRRHRGTHTNRFLEDLWKKLQDARSRNDVLDILRETRPDLLLN